MKVWSLPSLQSVSTWQDLRRFTSQALTNFYQVLTNNVGFQDNINCQIQTVTLTGGQNNVIQHNLGVIPIGYLVISQDTLGVVGTNGIPFTATEITLTTDVTGVYKIVILGS